MPVVVVGLVLSSAQMAGRAWRPLDFWSYWQASQRLGDLYPPAYDGTWFGYVGPPPLAQLFSLVNWLPHEVVGVAWITLNFAALWYATRAFALPIIATGLVAIGLGVPYLSAPLGIVLLGNAGMLMTAAIVATVRYPAASAFVFLAKLGPGVALLYHWRDRRAMLTGIMALAACGALSVAFTPTAWPQWIGAMLAVAGQPIPFGGNPIPLWVRGSVGVMIILYAGWKRIPWLVPIGAGLCIPADYGASFLTVWVGALGLRGDGFRLPSHWLRGVPRDRPVPVVD